MSITTNSFETYSPSYENISNRMNRLKQNKHSSSLTQIRPNSVGRKSDLNLFTIDVTDNNAYKPRRRLSPTNFVLNE